MPRFLSVLVFLGLAFPAQAARVAIPLSLDGATVERYLGAALGLDAAGTATLTTDDCNLVSLTDPVLTADDGSLHLSLAVEAQAGSPLFGGCLGVVNWQGRLHALIRPAVTPDGMAIRLKPESAELRQPDDSPGLLTRPARLLAEQLILPRLGDARVDLEAPLRSLDELIAGLIPAEGPPLLQDRVRLGRVDVHDNKVTATLMLDVAPAPTLDAAREPVLDKAELKEWQLLEDELDGFLTAVISYLATRAGDPDLRVELLGVLLDSRLAIARSLSAEDESGPDPVRELFIESWDRLRPHVARLAETGAGSAFEGVQLATFVAGADAIRALDALGPEYGVEISRDGLRRLARLLLAEDAPTSFTPLPLEVDAALRELFGLDAHRDDSSGTLAPNWWRALSPISPVRASIPAPAKALRTMTPTLTTLDDYLGLVDELLGAQTQRRLENDTRLPVAYRSLFQPLVRATAWKESCWRHYLDNADPPRVIRSSIGAVGMMQINVRVWRGLYDMMRLEMEVEYNVNAGIEILEHYLVDYALRRGEHEREGGADNLVRAVYAAYNGGPGQMSRYRNAGTPTRLKAIDQAFWNHFQHIKTEGWPDVASCYPI